MAAESCSGLSPPAAPTYCDAMASQTYSPGDHVRPERAACPPRAARVMAPAAGLVEDVALRRAIHSGVCEPALWQTFLDLACERFSANYVNIVFRRSDKGREKIVELFGGEPVPPHIVALYSRDPSIDPVRYHMMEPERVFRLHDMLETNDVESHPHYQLCLRPAGIDWVRLFAIEGPRDYRLWVTISRCHHRGDFSDDEHALFGSLAPDFTLALGRIAAMERSALIERLYSRIIDKLDTICLAVDRGGRVLIDAAMLRDRDALGSEVWIDADDALRLRTASQQRWLHRQLEAIADGATSRPVAMRLADDSGIDIMLVPLIGAADALHAKHPVASVYIRSRHAADARHLVQLVELFKLTASEARLALLLAFGHSLRDSAALLALRENTVRHYSKRIFAKMGVRGQPDMIRTVLTSVIMLA